ncbi:hypothetical protein A7U43_11285 [Mycobacterium adipatum]|uniref:Uncharacterized protein n=1 Tax=Mycobacterium adipatum TaxID=1682113 RepID=A0A172ULC8_9MYCO|nr:hypothetical protein [Mycobacterium adipatum]ANE79826.1 hypothetical protein A7U43_11285 [Mycobacterium adipatum]
MRYRLDVVAPSVAEVVRNAGGWLVDRVMAGWDVTVLVTGDDDIRPLQILGVETADLEAVMALWEERPHPQTVAVAAELFVSDARVRAGVLGALEQGFTEVTLWGEQWPEELDSTIDSVQHELSAAARAFKVQALAAVGDTDPFGRTEAFRCGVMSCPSVAADLVPAS